MSSYWGSIPDDAARNLIEALAPVCDLLAQTPHTPKVRQYSKRTKRVEEHRWILYRALSIAHESLRFSDEDEAGRLWVSSPLRKRINDEADTLDAKGEWDSATCLRDKWWLFRQCGRPTKGGAPCRNKMSSHSGAPYCHLHMTDEERFDLAAWQRQVHLPWPRQNIDSAVDSMVSGLEAMTAEMADMA